MITPKDRAAWASRRKHQRFNSGGLAAFAVLLCVLAAGRFWMTWKGWNVLLPEERERLLSEVAHPDWTSSRRGIEVLVRDNFLSGIYRVELAFFAFLGLLLQRVGFAQQSRMWSHIETLESRPANQSSEAG